MALYARASTSDRGDDPQLQLDELREVAEQPEDAASAEHDDEREPAPDEAKRVTAADDDRERLRQLAEQKAYSDGYMLGALDAARYLVLDPLYAESEATLAALRERDRERDRVYADDDALVEGDGPLDFTDSSEDGG